MQTALGCSSLVQYWLFPVKILTYPIITKYEMPTKGYTAYFQDCFCFLIVFFIHMRKTEWAAQLVHQNWNFWNYKKRKTFESGKFQKLLKSQNKFRSIPICFVCFFYFFSVHSVFNFNSNIRFEGLNQEKLMDCRKWCKTKQYYEWLITLALY